MDFISGIQDRKYSRPTDIILQLNKLKKRNHKFTSMDSERTFDIIQHPFIIKALSKLRIERNFLDWIKSSYKYPTANITLNGKRLNAFTLKSGTKWISFSHKLGEHIYKIYTE